MILKQSMFTSFNEEVYFIPPYLSSDRVCWSLFWVRNRTHPQTPPKLSSLEWIKFQPLENKDMRKLVVWRICLSWRQKHVIFSILIVEMTLKRKGRKMKWIYAHIIKINANNFGDSTAKPHQIDTSLESRFIV